MINDLIWFALGALTGVGTIAGAAVTIVGRRARRLRSGTTPGVPPIDLSHFKA